MSKKRLFVTGASGYIASNLLNCFDKKNFLDSFEKIYLIDKAFDRDRLDFELSKYGNIEIVEKDISASMEIANDDGFEDTCIHAAYISDFHKEKAFLDSFSVETYMVFLSSSAVYGESLVEDGRIIPSDESQTLKPISNYGRYKRDLEEFISQKFNKSLHLRISNPYGLEPDTRGVMKIFKERILEDKKIRLNEPESAQESDKIVRDFIYIEDLAKAVCALLESQECGVFNIASGDGIALQDLIRSFAESYKKEAKIDYLGHKTGDIVKSVLDVSKLEKVLGAFRG